MDDEDEPVVPLTERYPAPWLARALLNYRDYTRRRDLNMCAQRVEMLNVAVLTPRGVIDATTRRLAKLDDQMAVLTKQFVDRHLPALRSSVKTHADVVAFLTRDAPAGMREDMDALLQADYPRAGLVRDRNIARSRVARIEAAVRKNMHEIDVLALKSEYLDVLLDATTPIDVAVADENVDMLADIQANMQSVDVEDARRFEEFVSVGEAPSTAAAARLATAIADAVFPRTAAGPVRVALSPTLFASHT